MSTSSTLPPALVERMAEQARASRASTTWCAYARDRRIWQMWAAEHGVSPIPAEAEAVAAFLSDLSATRKLSTLRRYLASVSVGHQAKGIKFEVDAPAIRAIMKGIAKEKTGDARRVAPFMPRHALGAIDTASTLVEIRDAAMLSLGIAMAGRRSEIAGLDWLSRGSGAGVVELADPGALVRIFKSKTIKVGEPEEIAVQDGPALRTVKLWVERAGIAAGTPLFRGIGNRGKVRADRLHDCSVARAVKRAAAAAVSIPVPSRATACELGSARPPPSAVHPNGGSGSPALHDHHTPRAGGRKGGARPRVGAGAPHAQRGSRSRRPDDPAAGSSKGQRDRRHIRGEDRGDVTRSEWGQQSPRTPGQGRRGAAVRCKFCPTAATE
jgi:hypothetical protein